MGTLTAAMRGAGLALAMAAAAPAVGATIDYTSFHVLGDSLSDRGNVYRSSLRQVPKSPPYWHGRFSNGPVWAEHVADAFRAERLPTGIHAWGGATARTTNDGIPDLWAQATRYRALDDDRRGDRPLLALWAGGNDILNTSGTARSARVGRAAARAVGDTAALLARGGVGDFLIFDLPDLGRIPKYADSDRGARAATAGARAFNRQLRREIIALREDGATVRKVSSYALFNALLDDPRAFGLRDATTPCLDGNDNPCSTRQGRQRAFFDEIHPNFVLHRRIAETAMDGIDASGSARSVASVAPVPLPGAAGLLLIALAGLVAAARRR